MDGEFGGQHDVVKICNKRQALKIMLESQETDSEEMTEEEEN